MVTRRADLGRCAGGVGRYNSELTGGWSPYTFRSTTPSQTFRASFSIGLCTSQFQEGSASNVHLDVAGRSHRHCIVPKVIGSLTWCLLPKSRQTYEGVEGPFLCCVRRSHPIEGYPCPKLFNHGPITLMCAGRTLIAHPTARSFSKRSLASDGSFSKFVERSEYQMGFLAKRRSPIRLTGLLEVPFEGTADESDGSTDFKSEVALFWRAGT